MSKRKREVLSELYSKNVQEIAERVARIAKYTQTLEEIPLNTAIEMALDDFKFWYNDDEQKEEELVNRVYAHFGIK